MNTKKDDNVECCHLNYLKNHAKRLEYQREYYKNNKEKIARARRLWYLKHRKSHKEEIVAYRAEYYKNNKTKFAAYKKKYREKNKKLNQLNKQKEPGHEHRKYNKQQLDKSTV